MIPPEAVEAARQAMAKGSYQMRPGELPYADAARRVVEAVAPHMVIQVHHHDIENHARSFNEGYETAMAQHLADDPSLAGDWLDEKLREARAGALEDAALAFEISPHNSRAKMARHFNNAYVKKLRVRAAAERSEG